MTLHPEWKAILTKAWSIRFILASIGLDALAAILQAIIDNGAVSIALTVVAGIVNAFAVGARLVAQSNMPANT